MYVTIVIPTTTLYGAVLIPCNHQIMHNPEQRHTYNTNISIEKFE